MENKKIFFCGLFVAVNMWACISELISGSGIQSFFNQGGTSILISLISLLLPFVGIAGGVLAILGLPKAPKRLLILFELATVGVAILTIATPNIGRGFMPLGIIASSILLILLAGMVRRKL